MAEDGQAMADAQGQCPKCGESNSYSLAACAACGARLPWADALKASRAAPSPSPPPARPKIKSVLSKPPQGVSPSQKQNAVELSALPSVGDGWYYAVGGKRIGPKSEAQVAQLILDGDIRPDTRVWRHGMQDWTAAHLTPLSPLIQSLRNEPPPLAPDEVSNAVVWVLAFAPILSMIVTAFMAASMRATITQLWWIPVGINVLLCLIDDMQLRSAGHDTKGLTGFALFLVPPVYLFMRAGRLRESSAYAWVWWLSFVLSLFIRQAHVT